MQSFIERYGKSLVVAFGLGMLFVFLMAQPAVNAVPAPEVLERTESVRLQAQERAAEARAAAQAKREDAQQRLEGKRLEICQKREQRVQNIMARIADRGEKHLDVFTTIADRVQAFYEEKGLNAENYDELVAEVEAKREAADLQVATTSELSVDFSCEENSSPKGIANVFKDQLHEQINALKEYRTAVKDLIVGVKTSIGEGEEDA